MTACVSVQVATAVLAALNSVSVPSLKLPSTPLSATAAIQVSRPRSAVAPAEQVIEPYSTALAVRWRIGCPIASVVADVCSGTLIETPWTSLNWALIAGNWRSKYFASSGGGGTAIVFVPLSQ